MTDLDRRARPLAAGPSRPAATPAAAARSSSPRATTTGARRPRATAPIDALYRAVDKALVGVLTGHPRLLAYDIHALGEGTDTIGAVTVRIAPPDVAGERGQGEYTRRGARAEHHRRLDRGVHRGAQRAARRGALVRRDRGGRQPAWRRGVGRARRASSGPTSTRTKVPQDTTAWFER